MTTHKERIQTTLAGKKPDRTPIALWRHFPVDDQRPDTLAAATLHFQQTYDFDIVKVTPASSFAVRDWGVEDQWTGDTEGTRNYTKRMINKPGDWEKLPLLDPTSIHLARQLACLRLIREKQAKAAIVVLGGFHAQGFEQKLKTDGFSYLIVTPKMDSLKGHGELHLSPRSLPNQRISLVP